MRRDISKRELERRAVVARVQQRIFDILGEFETGDDNSITYMECLTALHTVVARLQTQLQMEEWRDDT